MLSTILLGFGNKFFWVTVIAFLLFEWISAEVYILLKKRSHKKKVQKKREKLNSSTTLNFYDLPWEV